MSWFALSGDARLGRCATENCEGTPAWRLEADGAGSNYCSGCADKFRNRPAYGAPGGCECLECGAIFVGAEHHEKCGICAAVSN